MKKNRKKLKGITLVEIIISLAVVSVLTLVLVTVSSTINTYIKSANNVNKKVAQQAPVAEVKKENAAVKLDGEVDIVITGGTFTASLKGTEYAVEDPDSIDRVHAGDELNMKFVVLYTAPATTAVTPAVTTTATPTT